MESLTALICLLAWAVPGAGHLWQGRIRQGLVFIVTLPLMFVTGLWLEGRIFLFDVSEPLVALAAVADFGIGLLYVLGRVMNLGSGNAVAATYEYGNSFLIVAGLLNALVVVDAYDVSLGRK
ncbi:MAG: DUF6677 family protein [Acidobacteriota bacterium]|nr:DUF6677 family protein [Acidobacteriota bacterium]